MMWFESTVDELFAGLFDRPTPVIHEGYLEFETPGVPRDQISVKLEGSNLFVSWTDRTGAKHTHSYSAPSQFYDHSKVDCRYLDGLLTVKIPVLKPKSSEKVGNSVTVEIG